MQSTLLELKSAFVILGGLSRIVTINMKKIFTIGLVFLMHSLHTQILIIQDKTTKLPIGNVEISSKQPVLLASTDSNGRVDISGFKGFERITISKFGYKTVHSTYKHLEALGFVLELSSNVADFDRMVFSVTRWSTGKLETPNRIEKINMKEVGFQNPQTTADMLGASGYAFIQKSQLGGGSPMLRGYATNRLLFVIDGVRMNTAIFRAGNLQNVISLDANAMESAEIVFGPGSVIYGSDAIGGVMSFQTLEPKFSDSGVSKPKITGNALMRNSTANSEFTGHIDLNIGFKKWAFASSFTRSDYGDLRSGSMKGNDYFYRKYYVQTIDNKDYMVKNNDSTLQVGSKYDQINFMQKVSFKPNKFLEFNYGFHLSQTSSYNRYDRLYVMQTSGPYKDKLRWAEWYYGPQKWNMQRLGIVHSKANKFYNTLKATAALQIFEESRFEREFMFRELHMQKERVRAFSFNLDAEKTMNSKTSLYYGLELVHNTVRSEAELRHVITKEVSGTVTRYPDGSTWACFGVYADLKHKLSDKWMFNSGIRYSYYKIKAVFDTLVFPFPFANTEMQNGALNGSLGVVYTYNKNFQMYFNAATGFRAPNIDDMGKVFESTPGYLVVPNPNLKPEKVYNIDLGFVKTFGNFLRVDATAYRTFLDDAMVRKDFTFNGQPTIRYLGNPSKIQAVQNVTQIQVYGIQAGAEFSYKKFGLRSTLSYQQGKEQSPDSLVYYPLRHAAPTFGSTHVYFSNKLLRVEFYTVYNAKMDYEQLALTERINASYAKDDRGLNYSAAWYTLNLKAAVNVNSFVNIMAGVENLTDRLYRPYSSGINAPGRNFIFSLRARF
jgi:hemoglobin/transferrin/lactoferrin receptor protein